MSKAVLLLVRVHLFTFLCINSSRWIDKFAPRAYCGFIAVLANAKRYLYINCSYSQRESRLRPDSILVMRGEEQLITQHFNMKRHSLVPPITNILTKKITVSHKFSLAFTKDTDCCILYNIFPVMNYDTAWFAFFFGLPFAIKPRPPLLGGLGTLVWSAFGAHHSAITAFTPAQTNRTKRDNEL